jgi:ankyrin repeat protein
MAAQEGHVAVVDALIAAGADMDVTVMQGVTPLSMAAQEGETAVVVALLKGGASVNKVKP